MDKLKLVVALLLSSAFYAGCGPAGGGTPNNSSPVAPVNHLNHQMDQQMRNELDTGIHPYFVVLMGKVSRQDLEATKMALAKIVKSDKYKSNQVLREEPISWSVHQTNVLDQLLIETTGSEIENFRENANRIPGLSVVYRPVEHVQATLTLSINNLDDSRIHEFSLGEALNVKDVSHADLKNPSTYLFVSGDQSLCKAMDPACLKYLSDRGFLDDKEDFLFPTDNGNYRRRQASVKEIIKTILTQSLQKVRGEAASLTKIADNKAPAVGLGAEMNNLVGGMELSVMNVKFSELKARNGSLPVNPSILYTNVMGEDGKGFIHDTPERYLYQLPIYDINPIRTKYERSNLYSLEKFYTSMLSALN